jgi:hypothetical protein
MKLLLQLKNVYGVERIYPVCEVSKIFCKMAKQLTISKENLAMIKELGYEIEWVPSNFCLDKKDNKL